MSNPAPDPDETVEEPTEMEHFEDTFKKLLKVPKSEVEELRKQEKGGKK
jgi:hypothetical protein